MDSDLAQKILEIRKKLDQANERRIKLETEREIAEKRRNNAIQSIHDMGFETPEDLEKYIEEKKEKLKTALEETEQKLKIFDELVAERS